ncbi:MAG: hypothetical protein BroJett018_23060 [Chloroflexota bacterium]|nr:hypothetical protein [Chloroflexota bacterium]NOG63253.1 hypothetical protein [Chloroflexota bacterium]GIK64512.1 MAG: hypothetical protein BroJett018_23060 [Chloroflexota bacterium]
MRYSYKRLFFNLLTILTILVTGTLGGVQGLLKDSQPQTALADDPPTQTPTPEPPPPTDGNEGDNTTDPTATTETPVAEPTEGVITVDPAASEDEGGIQAQQTYCQMDIGNSNDTNPYTYTFTALHSPDIVNYTWNFGDGFTATGPGPHAITYTAAGVKAITLNCDALPQLTGSISITTPPNAAFTLNPANYTGLLPITVQTINASTPSGLTYVWQVTAQPAGDPTVYPNATTQNASWSFGYYGAYTIQLTVTDGAGLFSILSRSVALNAPQPSANFSMVPSDGTAPLTVTIVPEDLGTGPITSWSFDFGDGTPVQTFTQAAAPAPFNHTYTANGPLPNHTYDVVMTYTGPGGSGTVTRQVGVYPSGQVVVASFTYQFTGNNPGGQIEVCFTNTSTGPILHNRWNFGDGTPVTEDNNTIVCHLFANQGLVTVILTVDDGGTPTPASSTDTQTLSIVSAPIASFTSNPSGAITWGTNVNFTDTSTGAITAWSWDFNGDGVEDSNLQNPTNIPVGNILGNITLGGNPIRLTVTGPGGSSYAEMTITVNLLQLTCGITGDFDILPGDPAQTYNSNVGNINSRTVTYNWTVTGVGAGLPITGSGATINVDWAAIGFGSFQLEFTATTPDGASCADSQTVTRSWLPLNCLMGTTTPALPNPLYANGATYTFSSNVQNLSGRTVLTYRWYVDGVLQAGQTGPTFAWTNTTVAPGAVTPIAVRYEVDVDNGAGYTPATSTCFENLTFNLNPWPTLTCTGITGPGAPVPVNATTGASVTQNYTATLTGLAGRPASYLWTVSDGVITTPNPRLNNATATVRWNTTAGSLPPLANDAIQVAVTVTNPDGTTVNCNFNRTITVTYNNLTCGLPVGDNTPVVGETVGYTPNIGNPYGRTITYGWTLEIWDSTLPVPAYVPFATGIGTPYNITFPTVGAQYRLRYTANAAVNGAIPADNCTSNWQVLTVQGTTPVSFACDGWGGGNNYSPANPGNFAYNIDIDNGNGLPLRYTWRLLGPGGYNQVLADSVNTPIILTNNGVFASPAFTFNSALLAPVGVDDFTLRVDVADSSLTTTDTCFLEHALAIGTFNVSYTYTGNASAIAVGQSICFTNTSGTSFDGIGGLTYLWNFGTANTTLGTLTSTAAQPGCLSFNAAGTYNVTLVGTNPSGSRTNAATPFSVTFNVYPAQSLAINRTGSNFAGTNQTFNAIATNLTGNLRWRGYDAANNLLWTVNNVPQNGSVTRFFATPGLYTVVVDGNGPLGPTSASLQFTLIDINSISASFTPSLYAGQAPMTVCFTDTSTGNNITDWAWDFGNGQTLVYTNSSIPASICTSYTTPGGTFPVTLNIHSDVSGLDGTATNQIRTYNPLEASATFTITPNGTANFCFTAVLPVGVSVTSWDFGDTTTGPAQNTICHNFASSGTYQVSMHITNGTTTGIITRPVVVNLSNPNPVPALNVSGTCSAYRVASFTVTNTGDAMVTPDQVTIRDLNGVVVLTDAILLGANQSQTFTVSNLSGVVTFSSLDFGLTANTTCNYPPDLTANGTCSAYRVASFTITNTGGPMPDPDTVTIRDLNNNVVLTQSFQLAANGTQTFTVNNLSGPVTMTTGTSGVTANTTCNYPPDLTANGTCSAYRVASFTITNTGGPMPDPDTVTIRDLNNNVVLTQSFQLAANGTQTFTVNNLSGPVTMTTGTSGVTANTTCNYPPDLTANGTCSAYRVASFTITNTGGPMPDPDTVTIRDLNNNVVLTQSFQLAANGTQTFTVNNLSGPVTMTTGTSGVTANTTCNYPPDLTASGTCSAYRVASFTITNDGGPMPDPDTVTIRDLNNNVVLTQSFQLAANGTQIFTVNNLSGPVTMTTGTSGVTANTTCNYPPDLTANGTCSAYRVASFTITNDGGPMPDPDTVTIRDLNNNVVLTQSFQLAANGTQTFTVNNLSGPVTMSTGTSGVTANTTCNYPPDVSAIGICSPDRVASFTISNNGGPMPDPDTATIRDRNGVVVLSQPFQLTANGSAVFSVNNMSGPVTFTTSSTAITASATCEYPPNVSVFGACNSMTVSFTISNSDGPMIAPQTYEIRDGANNIVRTGTFQLARGAAPLTVFVSPTIPNTNYRFVSTGNIGSFDVPFTCYETDDLPPATPNPNSPTSLVPTIKFPVVNGTTGTVYDDVSPSAPWRPVPGCGYQCVTFQVYHTNRTGDWEIFRLGDYPGQPDANPNLSRGEGEGVDDVAPSRSPNGEWIAFASNRDGNWELYVSRTDGSELHRVTFNSVAIDTDPAWGPNNTLVFETTRDGNWELYLLDLSTGVEMRLTDDAAADINPFWSPDGAKLVFQSDRSGKWQIYELNLATMETILLSDGQGEDVDPAYSAKGDRIAFRSTREGSTNAIIFVMDANGGTPVTISDVAGDATNHTWSTDDTLIAYQSNLDGDLDVYVYDFGSGTTRQITDNVIADYAPTWVCGTNELIFTSDVMGNPDIFETNALPIDAPAIKVEEVALQLTDEPADDVYPQSFPAEENASREGKVPAASMEGIPSIQTDYLHPELAVTPIDPTNQTSEGVEAMQVNGCSALACVDSLLYHTNQTNDWEIFRLDLDGLNPVAEANLSRGIGEGIHDVAPTRSPNGDYVAFVSNRDGNWELYIASADGSFVQRATYNEGVDTDPVWAPNGESLVFESNRDGNWELYSLDFATGQVMRLTVDEGSDINPFWSPASGSIVFQSDRNGQWQLYSLNMSTYETTLLSDGSGNDYDPVYSNAGDYIAFRSDRQGGSVLFVMDKSGANVTAISDAAGNASNATWYNDDELLAYQSDVDGDMDIYVYEFNTGETRKVTENGIADYAPTWACDAPNVVFTSNVLGAPDIFVTPALPITADSVDVALNTNQLTFGLGDNLYPENTPNEENASRENYLPTR